jgi:hypothetical protein
LNIDHTFFWWISAQVRQVISRRIIMNVYWFKKKSKNCNGPAFQDRAEHEETKKKSKARYPLRGSRTPATRLKADC